MNKIDEIIYVQFNIIHSLDQLTANRASQIIKISLPVSDITCACNHLGETGLQQRL